jgi:hypothetical protein
MGTAAMCAAGGVAHSFWLLVASTLVAGFYSANGALYRFAGPELVAPAFKERAISWVLAGGIVGAFIGPNLASATRSWLAVPFAGAYLALVGVGLLSLRRCRSSSFRRTWRPAPGAPAGRPLAELARQPVFAVAIIAAALGYGVMNLLMAATPIAMQQCQHPFEQRRAGAGMACAGHVRAELLHRPADQALRRRCR